MMEAADLLGREDLIERISHIAEQALNIGWDKEFGGILHYSAVSGGPPENKYTDVSKEIEPAEQQVREG